MAKTYDEYMRMAAKAHEAGEADHAKQLVQLAKQAKTQEPTPGPTFREPEAQPYPDVLPAGATTGLARQKVESEAFKLTPEQEAEALKKAEAEARRKEGALVSPGGRIDVPRLPEEEPGMFERALDFVPEVLQTAYEFYKPEAQEDIREVFKRQPVMTPEAVKEAEARVEAAGEEPLAEYLPDALRLSVKGVETPLAATLRGLTAPFTGAVELAAREALTYEVDPTTGQPRDPDDYSYLAEQALRGVLGDENYPATLSSGGVLGGGLPGKALDVPAKVNKKLRDAGVPQSLAGFLAEGITVPTFGPIDYGEGAAPDVKALDPYGFRKADTRLDWSDQIIRNARVDRSMKDLYVDMPEVRRAYKEAYGAESAAFYGGLLADMFVPDATMLAGPIAKGAKVVGKAADAGLTAVAANRLYGGNVAAKALLEATEKTGEGVAKSVAKVVAREAVAPKAIIDLIDLEGDVGRALQNIPDELRSTASGKWMIRELSNGRAPAAVFAEMRIAQNASDIQRVWDATIAAGKSVQEARAAAFSTARAVLGSSKAGVPRRVVEAISQASDAKGVGIKLQAVVPRNASTLSLGSSKVGGGALRNTMNLADDAVAGVGLTEALGKVEDSVLKTLGELVPRDMVAVTSKVMIPREAVANLRKAVSKELEGVLEVAGAGFRVSGSRGREVVKAISRVYPTEVRGDFWDDVIQAVQKGDVLPPSTATRLTDALQTDAYLRAGGEKLANIGLELEVATGASLTRFLEGNIVARVGGAFLGKAKNIPGAYASMGKRIGQETFGIPRRVADLVRSSAKAGEADPFRSVGEDLASKADEVGMGDNFLEEAWANTLSPLYGPQWGKVKDLITKGDQRLEGLLRNPPTLAALEEIDNAIVPLIKQEVGVREAKDFGSALLSGLVEAEAWVTARRVALETLQDTPGLSVTLSPGLRNFPPEELPALVSRALADIMSQGTTRALDPNPIQRGFGPGSLEAPDYQAVLDAVGTSLRAMGVHYLDSLPSADVAAYLASRLEPQSFEIPGAIQILTRGLEPVLNPEGYKRLAEGVEVLRRVKDKSLIETLVSGVEGLEALGRNAGELASGSNVIRAASNVFSMPVAIMAREGLNTALNLSGRAIARRVLPRKEGELFIGGGRPWTRAAVDEEAARLGVGASTKQAAARRGRLAADLMADLERGLQGSASWRGADLTKQVVESSARIIPELVDSAEKQFRLLGFEEGLRRGMTPEAAAAFSRDLLFDFEPLQLQGWKRAFTPLIATGVEAAAAIRSLIERPQEAVRIMRASQARQDYEERTYGGDDALLEPTPGVRPLGGAAAAFLAGVVADAYYGRLTAESLGINPVTWVKKTLGTAQTFIEGSEEEALDDLQNIMLLASMADQAGGRAGAVAGWDALVARYGLVPTNVTKEGVLPEAMVPAGTTTRYGTPPRGGEQVPLAYRMSPEGKKQFRKDWAWAKEMTLGTLPLVLQAWNDTGMAPEVRKDRPSEPADVLYRQASQATGRGAAR